MKLLLTINRDANIEWTFIIHFIYKNDNFISFEVC